VSRAAPSGILPEQAHPVSGVPLSVAPLTWSHAAFVSAVLDYLERLGKVYVCASGDLTKRKIMPALYHLFAEDRIGPDCIILGAGRKPMDDGTFRALTLEALSEAGLGA